MYLFIQGHHVWAASVSRRRLHWCVQCARYTHHIDNITWNLQVSLFRQDILIKETIHESARLKLQALMICSTLIKARNTFKG